MAGGRCARCAGTGSAPDRVAACIRLTPRDAAPASERQKPRSVTWAFTLLLVAGAGFEPATFGL